jgi:hypothetical protein
MRATLLRESEVIDESARVVSLPRLIRTLAGVLLIERNEQIGDLAAHGLGAEQLRQLRQLG